MKTLLKQIKKSALYLALLGALMIPAVAITQTVAAQTPTPTDAKSQVCEGVGLTTGGNGCTDTKGSPTVESTIGKVVNILSLVVGIAAVIMIIIGGLKYILSSGDSSNVNSAKNTILYAIVGLVVVLLAQVIVRFVINRVTP